MAYPHIAKSGWLSSLFSSNPEPPTQEKMQSWALSMYLQRYEPLLCDFNFESTNTQTILEGIINMFRSLHEVWTCVDNGNEPHTAKFNQLTKVC